MDEKGDTFQGRTVLAFCLIGKIYLSLAYRYQFPTESGFSSFIRDNHILFSFARSNYLRFIDFQLSIQLL